MEKNPQKSNEEYRRDIFTLKSRIKQEQSYLEQIKQKCSQIDIFVEQSYSFQMKMSILANDLEVVKDRIRKYDREESREFYQLNFSVYAMFRACQIVGFNCEMVFRMIDIEAKRVVKSKDFGFFLRDVLRLDSVLANPILVELDPKETGEIQEQRYNKLLKCFMLDKEPTILKQGQKQKNEVLEAMQRVGAELIKAELQPKDLWKAGQVNIATTAFGLKRKMANLDNLDCVAVYCRCDPTKQGAVETTKVVEMLEIEMEGLRKFDSGGLKKIKLKRNE